MSAFKYFTKIERPCALEEGDSEQLYWQIVAVWREGDPEQRQLKLKHAWQLTSSLRDYRP